MCLKRSYKACLLVFSLFVLTGCNSDERNESPEVSMFPFKGKVLLNGSEPEYKISVTFNPTEADATGKKRTAGALVGKGGVFESTAPAGKYKLTFELKGSTPSFKTESKQRDLLGKKYSNPADSKFDVEIKEVTGEEVNDLGEFSLEAELDEETMKKFPPAKIQ